MPCRRFSKRRFSRRFGETAYQKQVNSLTGAMGPTRGAFWRSYTTTTGNPTSLAAQPLYYNPKIGEYVTSFVKASGPASIDIYPNGTVNFSSGGGSKFGKRRRRSKGRKSRRKSKRKSKGKSRRRVKKANKKRR